MIFSWKWIAIPLLALPLTVSAGKQRQTYEMDATGEIEINPDAAVRNYTLQSDLAPAIAAMVNRNVLGWKFEPILVDGKPVIGKTNMRLALSATPMDGDLYSLKVENVWFGQPELPQKMNPPRYPMEAVYANFGAKVVLVLRLDPQGNVVEVFPEQTSLTATGNQHVVEKWRRIFEKVSIATARKWKFNMTEKVNGKAIESSVRIPISYRIVDDRKSLTDHWQGFIAGPIHSVPWVQPGSIVVAGTYGALEDGEAEPLTSRFRLKQAIVGTTL